MEALWSCYVANSFESKFIGAHHFNDVESCPANIVTDHLKLKIKIVICKYM